jgi:hypothetical protein
MRADGFSTVIPWALICEPMGSQLRTYLLLLAKFVNFGYEWR